MVTPVTAGAAGIAGIGSAFPVRIEQQALWDGWFAGKYGENRIAARAWSACRVETRHAVVDPRHEDVSTWTTGQRMERYAAEALPLGKEAVSGALADAGVDAGDVGQFVVASCTGYVSPGPDLLLARDLGMPADVRRLVVGHMGCYAALPALAAAADYVRLHDRPAVVLCLELPSLHLQPLSPTAAHAVPSAADIEQVITHALFADAAAAAVLVPGRGSTIVDVQARTDADSSGHMSWHVTDLGFRMGLSPEVPDVLARHVGPAVDDLLARHGLVRSEVAGWAVHPGGPRILRVVEQALQLGPQALQASYDVLKEVGNCSSPTVLLVLERVLAATPAGPVVALAFGPGLTLYAGLLQAS
ncbi:MAG: putative naringenin-chalcone synthase [Frankiales bacterium]|nr:putative naringenin-chalcone synthase [Frankiales bacterium]